MNAPLQSQYQRIHFNSYQDLAQRDPLTRFIHKFTTNFINTSGYDVENFKDASFKLHINLNEIGSLDQETLLGLIRFVNKESWAHNVRNFKVVNPEALSHPRFQNTAQLTIYLSNYASVADLMSLSEKINAYLLEQKLPENKITEDSKSSVELNSFASGRFDTCKAIKAYGEFPFMDNEIAKFFARHKDNKELAKIPLCAFDAIFNRIILSKSVDGFKRKALSAEHSKKVQLEFEKMLDNPSQYIKDMSNPEKNGLDSNLSEKEQNVQRVEEQLSHFVADFTDCDTEEELTEKIAQETSRLRQIVPGEPLKDNNNFIELLQQKEKSIAEQAQLYRVQLNKRPPMAPEKINNFKAALSSLEQLSEKPGPDQRRIKKFCSLIRQEFQSFKVGNTSFNDFYKNCKKISEASGLNKTESFGAKVKRILLAILTLRILSRTSKKSGDSLSDEQTVKEKLKSMRSSMNDLRNSESQTTKRQENTEDRSTELAPGKISL
ncbi:hypothetical protein B1207_01540 [Legionella quinlivanii]|uniref:Uncharacterized protein n=2 Tax=Legionella quinlivanii TaxID=45073 RepID=A0A364LNF6_9GAMM|nr:hypothetical protein B1207_01540 [Legionella quinlivanii]